MEDAPFVRLHNDNSAGSIVMQLIDSDFNPISCETSVNGNYNRIRSRIQSPPVRTALRHFDGVIRIQRNRAQGGGGEKLKINPQPFFRFYRYAYEQRVSVVFFFLIKYQNIDI